MFKHYKQFAAIYNNSIKCTSHVCSDSSIRDYVQIFILNFKT